ncbi:MAG: pyridoxal phosphate-dependent aminotransferase [Candidatus Aminicenantes bacterium]|nr:MAG: pyridoxal phosphate-dependent aminotransferase [Candidatus Aminicenantes bacterium]
MRFETIGFIEWMKTRARTKIDLTRSSVRNFSLKNLNVKREELEIFGPNDYGYPPLLEAVASRYKVKEENVVTAVGSSHAIFLVCAALIERGDEVLIETPVYEPLLAVPRAFDAVTKRFERRYDNGYQIDLEKFASLLSPKTKLIVLTNLHNPTGALLSRRDLRDLVGIAHKSGAQVLIDEIYLEFLEGAESETSFSTEENIIVISSLTKVFGLGGLRCGWILASSALAKRLRSIIDYINVDGVFIGEQISAKIFDQIDSIKDESKETLEKNMSMIANLIRKEEKLSWVEPAGGVVCFPRVEAGLSGDELASLLLERYDTSVVPGSFFEKPQHFRMGFGVRPDTLARGLENIKKVLGSGLHF